MNEDGEAIYYGQWKSLPDDRLRELRAELVEKPSAYPDYRAMQVGVIDRILEERKSSRCPSP